jgi:hypothetical protein
LIKIRDSKHFIFRKHQFLSTGHNEMIDTSFTGVDRVETWVLIHFELVFRVKSIVQGAKRATTSTKAPEFGERVGPVLRRAKGIADDTSGRDG